MCRDTELQIRRVEIRLSADGLLDTFVLDVAGDADDLHRVRGSAERPVSCRTRPLTIGFLAGQNLAPPDSFTIATGGLPRDRRSDPVRARIGTQRVEIVR